MAGLAQRVPHSSKISSVPLQTASLQPAERPPLFAGIVASEYQAITATARLRSFARGEMLYLRGEPVDQIVLVVAGWVKVTHLSQSGTEVIIKLGIPGDVLGAVALWSAGRHDTTAQAFRYCQAYVWEARAFRALTVRNPVLHQNMVRILGEDLLELGERFREVATEKVGARIAGQLLRLRKKIGRVVGNDIEIALSREELAQMTGTTLFTVSRLLSAWELNGVVKPSRESVSICDLALLQELAEER